MSGHPLFLVSDEVRLHGRDAVYCLYLTNYASSWFSQTHMQTSPRWLLVFVLFAFVVLVFKPLSAAIATLPVIEEVRVGLGGKSKVGHWTPVTVVLRGGAVSTQGELRLELLDGDGEPYHIQWDADRAVEIPAGQETQVETFAKFGRIHSDLLVVVRLDGGREISRRLTAAERISLVPSSQRLVAMVGDSAGVDEAIRRRAGVSMDPIAVAQIDRAQDLPRQWMAYGGVDALVLTTGRWEPYTQLSEQQLDAVEQWLSLGGRLLLCVGASGEELLGADGKLRRLAPGDFSRVQPLNSTRQLQALGGTAVVFSSESPRPTMSLLEDVRGRVEADESERNESRPLVIRAPMGLGKIVFCSVDLDTEPLLGWPGRDRFVGRVLELTLGEREASQLDSRGGEMAHVGFDDVSGQLRVALDQFPRVFVVPFSLVAALAALYIAIIGPLDYFVLRWSKGKMGWTWLTFSLTVLLFVSLSFFLAHYWKGSELSTNQVELVDIDASSGWTRGAVWTHIYSPRSQTFDLTLDPDWPSDHSEANCGVALTWNGLSGRGFGGMDSSVASVSLADSYTMEGHQTPGGGLRVGLRQFPVTVWSSRSLWGQWWCRSAVDVSSELSAGSDGQLQGSFSNPLPWDLEDCMLAYRGWAYPIGTIPSAERLNMNMDRLSRLRLLKNVLVRRQINLEEMKNANTPWDPRSVDVPRIMEMVMFHQAAGGRGYVKLTNRFRRSLDLSDQLTAGRAILVGHAKHSRASINRNGTALSESNGQHGTFYRIVLPVDSS